MAIKLGMLLVFFAVMVGIGLYCRRHASDVNGFVLGGRSVGPWLTAFAYGTSYFSAVVFVGYAGQFGWKYGVAATWAGIGNAILGSLLAFVLSFIPPSQISVGSNAVWFSVLIIGTLVVVIAPFIIYASRKPSWTNKESQFEPFHWEETAAPTTTHPQNSQPTGATPSASGRGATASAQPTPASQPHSKPTAPTTDPNAGTKGSTPPQP